MVQCTNFQHFVHCIWYVWYEVVQFFSNDKGALLDNITEMSAATNSPAQVMSVYLAVSYSRSRIENVSHLVSNSSGGHVLHDNA